MLALSSINPFDSREAKVHWLIVGTPTLFLTSCCVSIQVYQDDPEISAMASLRTAYEHDPQEVQPSFSATSRILSWFALPSRRQNDIGTIDQLLTNPSYRILSDAFIRTYLQAQSIWFSKSVFELIGSRFANLVLAKQDLLRNIRLQARHAKQCCFHIMQCFDACTYPDARRKLYHF